MRRPMARGSLAAKSRFESCVPRSGNGFFRKLCSSGSTRRKPLFPPPQETMIDPVTNQPRKKRLANKGRQPTHVLCVNGRIVLQRRWWHSSVAGSTASADTLIDRRGQTVTCGVIEMAARLNNERRHELCRRRTELGPNGPGGAVRRAVAEAGHRGGAVGAGSSAVCGDLHGVSG